MKRLLLALVLLSVIPGAAQAYTCGQVRAYVRTHTKEEVEAMKRTLTPAEIAAAEKCVGRRR